MTGTATTTMATPTTTTGRTTAPDDDDKDDPGDCGCGEPDDDNDGDGTADCIDECPDDPDKTEAGACGCGVSDGDTDGDGFIDCEDNCPELPNVDQADGDHDGVGTICDNCPEIPNEDQDDSDGDMLGDACACGPTPLPCEGGSAGGAYACDGIDLLARYDLEELGASVANDIWGWTDPQTDHEYALVGVNNGTVIFDVTHPYCPVYMGKLPTATSNASLRDIKTYGDHAFIVAEADYHGIQIYDLTQLRDITDPPVDLQATAHYDGHGHAHNIAADIETGFVYSMGASSCGGGLHIVDVRDPLTPTFAGCYSDLGYIHDSHCVVYDGPDSEHAGTEICMVSNGSLAAISIVDVTNKESPTLLSYKEYEGGAYSHQGWLTEDHRFYLATDEFDEQNLGSYTRTYMWDVQDLDDPILLGTYESPTGATDHNLYNVGNRSWMANYRAGVRVIDLTGVASGDLSEIAFFDTDPSSDGPSLSGAFSVYPFFTSGTVVVSDMGRGLFVLAMSDSPN